MGIDRRFAPLGGNLRHNERRGALELLDRRLGGLGDSREIR